MKMLAMKTMIGLMALTFCAVSSLRAADVSKSHSWGQCRPGTYKFKGKILRGQTFSRHFGGFVFKLVPMRNDGDWHIEISQGEHHGLELITAPQHFLQNPTDIEGWHFRNAANTGPNTGDVNAPDETRHFFFSPGWRRREGSNLENDGQGTLEITDMQLEDLKPGEKAALTMIKFSVTLNVGKSVCQTAWPEASQLPPQILE